jgi:hypothetical protein
MAKTKVSKPIPAVLPPYIVERDALARRSGLTVEHAWGGYFGTDLESVYRGTRAQLIASPFIEDKIGLRIPARTRHCVKAGVADFTNPSGHCLVGAFNAEDGSCYVKFRDEFPSKWGALEHGTQYFTFPLPDPCGRAVYRGARDALILDAVESEDGLARHLPDGETEDRRREQCGGYTYTLAEYRVLDGGVVEVVKYPDAERKYEEWKRQGPGGPSFKSEADYREYVRDTVELAARAILSQMEGRHEKSGDATLRFEQAQIAAVSKAFDDMRERIDLARIERHAKAALPKRSKPMTPDATGAFERFMRRATGDDRT